MRIGPGNEAKTRYLKDIFKVHSHTILAQLSRKLYSPLWQLLGVHEVDPLHYYACPKI